MWCKNSFGVLTLMGKEAEMFRYCLLGVIDNFSWRDARLMKLHSPCLTSIL